MSLDLDQIKKKVDKGYQSGQTGRQQASDDLVFARVTQWDDNLLEDTNLAFRGEFNILKKAHRQIMGDLAANPVQVDFEPKDENRDDGADLLDGMYRADDRLNTSQEAYTYASADAVDGGFGAWELFTEYSSSRMGDLNQVIRRKFIPEAVNCVFWDPNAKRQDKSDAKYCCVIEPFSEDGYNDLVKELTGEESTGPNSFRAPEHSYTFPWSGSGEGKKFYVGRFYHVEKIKDTALTFVDPMGTETILLQSQLDDVMDDMIDSGYEIVAEKDLERFQVTRYIMSGHEILKEEVIAGEYIPIIPMYGERYIVEGEEYYSGITRLAKDPQRLRNFQMSYLADIVSRSPRPKPIFFAEQIQGFEDMYDIAGVDNDYPYLLQNRKDANGNDLPIGPVAAMPDQPIPQALAASIELTRQAVEDVANPGIPQDIADPDLSGKAVIALQNRMDKQSYIFQHNLKFAKRRDGEVYASMAVEIMDSPRKLTVAKPDGTTMQVETMTHVIDAETGEVKVLNDLTNMEFDVYSDIGPSYDSQKEQTIDRLAAMAESVALTDPTLHKALILKILELTDGVNTDDIREYARKQLVLTGFKEPETDEEKQMLAEAQQTQQPDAAMVLAMAEDKKGQAQQMEAQTKQMVAAGNIQNEQAKRIIDQFGAQSDRMGVQVDAAEAGANIDFKRIDAMGKQLDNVQKQQEIANSAYRGRLDRQAVSTLQTP
jgi:polyhydroxyalkanoate synthesis regulator phasin